MTSKLKCPFCGAELLGTLYEKYCTNRECEYYMLTIPAPIWQALIDGKKAQDALKVATDSLYEIYKDYDISGYCEEFISRTLDKIAYITKQEKE